MIFKQMLILYIILFFAMKRKYVTFVFSINQFMSYAEKIRQ